MDSKAYLIHSVNPYYNEYTEPFAVCRTHEEAALVLAEIEGFVRAVLKNAPPVPIVNGKSIFEDRSAHRAQCDQYQDEMNSYMDQPRDWPYGIEAAGSAYKYGTTEYDPEVFEIMELPLLALP